MAKMVYRMKLIMCLAVATFISGCVSAGEKHARSELAQVEKTRYVLTESDSSTPLDATAN